MKCQSLFPGEKCKKNVISMSSAELTQRVVEVNAQNQYFFPLLSAILNNADDIF